mmetsp:Transcript_135888/g.271089  ORF Transcript_135888/g.271089 Transcript_135888/m.271089 type:complete len:252 (-) Transcript_135888:1003-1758(-)
MYRIISVSERMLLKIFCSRNGDVLAKAAGSSPSTSTALLPAPDLPTPAVCNAATSCFTSASRCVSSKLTVTWVSLSARQLSCFACSASTSAAGLAGAEAKATVSKKSVALSKGMPSIPSSFAKSCARPWTRLAIRCNPSLRWNTAYIPAMLASSTCAVQTFDVAFSRRICCSRVCRVSLYAGLPWRSMLSPMIRPGILRTCFFFVAIYAADGPPNHIGTPKRCMEPTTMSAPNSFGGFAATSASGSAATTK